jgi:toxin ParE1/3/4
MKLFVTPLAEADLNQILDYIAETRPVTAVSVLKRIREKCELISTNPRIGQLRPEFPGDYRSFPVQRWVIFYRIQGDTVEIHRVLDGARDIDSLLG